ncbi:MFS transporter [Thermodesulfobacteriota bacterium]
MDTVDKNEPPANGTGRWKALLFLSFAVLFAMSLWFSATAVLPALSREWQLGDGGRAGLTIAVQFGYIIGTLLSALGNLPDLYSPRIIMAVSVALGAVVNAALALWTESLYMALVLRAVTGLCMAGAYPPAMKIVATWFQKERGLAMGIMIGALTVGLAMPHLIRGVADLPWRWTLLVASLLALVACGIVLILVHEGPYRFPTARFNIHMALENFRNRSLRLACFGYYGHMWELFGMWAWIGIFLGGSFQSHGSNLNTSLATFIVITMGAVGSYLGGLASDRWGRTLATSVSLVLSGLCAITIGFTFGGPPILTFLVTCLWGLTVNADSAQFSVAATELSEPAYVGTSLTVQTCIGFVLTMISIWLIPMAIRELGWRWAFTILAVGPVFGVVSMARLRTLPESLKLAQGRR